MRNKINANGINFPTICSPYAARCDICGSPLSTPCNPCATLAVSSVNVPLLYDDDVADAFDNGLVGAVDNGVSDDSLVAVCSSSSASWPVVAGKSLWLIGPVDEMFGGCCCRPDVAAAGDVNELL